MHYHNITTEDMNNGDGLRTVLWVAGCEHHCPECQNPITWGRCGGLPFGTQAEEEIMKSLEPSYISGITFSGGDPLATYNREEVRRLIKRIREQQPGKSIWVYTGYVFEDLIASEPYLAYPQLMAATREILENIDILVDGSYKKELRDVSLWWRGSSNQRVIDVPQTLRKGHVVLHCF